MSGKNSVLGERAARDNARTQQKSCQLYEQIQTDDGMRWWEFSRRATLESRSFAFLRVPYAVTAVESDSKIGMQLGPDGPCQDLGEKTHAGMP